MLNHCSACGKKVCRKRKMNDMVDVEAEAAFFAGLYQLMAPFLLQPSASTIHRRHVSLVVVIITKHVSGKRNMF